MVVLIALEGCALVKRLCGLDWTGSKNPNCTFVIGASIVKPVVSTFSSPVAVLCLFVLEAV